MPDVTEMRMTNFILGEDLNEAVQFGFVSGAFDLPRQTVGISLPGKRPGVPTPLSSASARDWLP